MARCTVQTAVVLVTEVATVQYIYRRSRYKIKRGIISMVTLPDPNLFRQQYEAKVTEGEDYGYDKELENILIRHVQDVVGLRWKSAVCGQDWSSFSPLCQHVAIVLND